MSNTKKKKKSNNIFAAYFRPFGINQVCDILMLTSAILMMVGVFTLETLMMVGLIIFITADLTMLVKNILVLASKINHRSPEYRSAIRNTIITAIMLLIATFGLVYYFIR